MGRIGRGEGKKQKKEEILFNVTKKGAKMGLERKKLLTSKTKGKKNENCVPGLGKSQGPESVRDVFWWLF